MSRRAAALCALLFVGGAALAQGNLIRNPGFERDENADGFPDAWWDFRYALPAEGGHSGERCLLAEAPELGPDAHVYQGLSVEKLTGAEALLGVWCKLENVIPGEANNAIPQARLDFYAADGRNLGSAGIVLGQGTRDWLYCSTTVSIPAEAAHANLVLGLMGATGRAWFDDVSLAPPPRDDRENWLRNPGFEHGVMLPDAWDMLLPDPWQSEAARVSPGSKSDAALRLQGPARLAQRIWLSGAAATKGRAEVYVRGSEGKPAEARLIVHMPGTDAPDRKSLRARQDWRRAGADFAVAKGAPHVDFVIEVPAGEALLLDRAALRLDNVEGVAVERTALPERDLAGWVAYEPAEAIAPDSGLDVSGLLEAPAGQRGFVTQGEEALTFEDGAPARFYGVAVAGPGCFPEPERAEALAERIAQSGLNLVFIRRLDCQGYPTDNLFATSRRDTRSLAPHILRRLDRFVAELRKRGVYYAFELLGARRFRAEDEVSDYRLLPPGAGLAALFSTPIVDLQQSFADLLLTHENPDTSLRYVDDPALAFVVLQGVQDPAAALFRPNALPPEPSAELQTLWNHWLQDKYGSRAELNRAWAPGGETVLADDEDPVQATVRLARRDGAWNKPALVDARAFLLGLARRHQSRTGRRLRAIRVRVPIIPWLERRPGLLLGSPATDKTPDDGPPAPAPVELWTPDDEQTPTEKAAPGAQFAVVSGLSRAGPTPNSPARIAHLVGRWGGRSGALIAGSVSGVLAAWGSHLPGAGPGEHAVEPTAGDAWPSVFAQWPGAAVLFHTGQLTTPVPWRNDGTGRLIIDLPVVQSVAGRLDGEPAELSVLGVAGRTPFGVVTAAALDGESLKDARRVLVTAVGDCQPEGTVWADPLYRSTERWGDGRMVVQPVDAEVLLKRTGAVEAHALGADGSRRVLALSERGEAGVVIRLDPGLGALHFELVFGP